jgi:site-specific DNA recombinase
MAKTSKTALAADPARKQAVIYARVSSKEQEKEGFSIPAQLKLLNEYAATHGVTVEREFVDVETAKQTGRLSFGEMVELLRKSPRVWALLVEKTDRLYRNLKDWVTLDELDLEIHFVKEGVVLSRDSRSSEKFMHGIKVLMAKNYIDNLSEETRKGMTEKAEQGIWPSFAPLGYRNIIGGDGKKAIEPDPALAPIIRRIFEWYAGGQNSVREVARLARGEGMTFRQSGNAVPVSTIHQILRNRIYSGDFEWAGRAYSGRHEPIVSHELFAQVQDRLDGRRASKTRVAKHGFAFSGLITCGHCGCALVGEIKKGRYVYYHCTGYRGKCPEPYTREEVLEVEFGKLLAGLAFDAAILDWLREALRQSHGDERRHHEAAVARLQGEYNRLQARLDALYVDKLDRVIDAGLFDRFSLQWRQEQDRCLRLIEDHQGANRSYLDEGVRLLELAHSAHRLFQKQEPREKRRLLDFVLSNCAWSNGKLTVTYRQPFDLIAAAVAEEASAAASKSIEDRRKEIWLPGPDSNQRHGG